MREVGARPARREPAVQRDAEQRRDEPQRVHVRLVHRLDARLRGLAKAEVEPWIMAGEVASAGLPFQYLSDLVGYHRYPCSESIGVRSAHEQDL